MVSEIIEADKLHLFLFCLENGTELIVCTDIHSLTHSLTHLITYSLTYSLTLYSASDFDSTFESESESDSSVFINLGLCIFFCPIFALF